MIHQQTHLSETMNRQKNLIWLDLEMTGLSLNDNVIIEIATLVTNDQLEEVAVGPSLAIHQPAYELDKMDSWNVRQHGQSGLIERVKKSQVTITDAEKQTLDFLRQHVERGASPMCGSSICTDRRFLAASMPSLESFFHYRNLDVSTLKILAHLWSPQLRYGINKESSHLALSDIRDSIAELRFYRQHLLAKTETAK